MRLEPNDIKELAPVIREVVAAVLAEVGNPGNGTEPIGHPEPEAARLMGIAYHVLRDARRAGRLPSNLWRKIGREVVYNRRALDAFLASGSEVPQQDATAG